MKILLVDDVPMYLEQLREPLVRGGYSPVVAASAAEARLGLARVAPRLVFLDLQMPTEDGDRLCREIKRGAAPAPAVVMTGVGGRDEERRRCEAAGCDAFLAKPLRPAVILETAARFLRVGVRRPRVPLRVPVLFEEHGRRHLVDAVNVSTGGLFVATGRPLSTGTAVTVEFRLPLDRSGVPLRARGEIAWTNLAARPRPGVPIGMAVRFTEINAAVRGAVERFIERSLAAGRAAPAQPAGPGPARGGRVSL